MVNNDDREPGIERAVARLIDGLENHRLYTVAEKRRFMEEREQRRRDGDEPLTGPPLKGYSERWNFLPYPFSGSFAEQKRAAAEAE